jgi:membrane-associated phospholipid phosphatase/ketosteroid isomerase-like protein
MKAALSAGLTLFFCVPYFTLQRLTLFPARTLPLSVVDRAIDFDPAWVWAYQSAYLLLTIVPWMVTTRPELRRYARGFVLLSVVGFVCFLLMPVRGPRPDMEPTDAMLRILQWYDKPLNSFPSLHVGLAAYTVLFAGRVSRGRMTPAARWSLLSLAWLWTALIAYAALATKQHYAIDLPAGALLACACHWWTWRRCRPTSSKEAPAAAASERSESSRSEWGWGPTSSKKGAWLMLKGQSHVRVCLTVLWVFWSASAAALPQPAAPPAPAANEEADHEALRRLKTAYEEAIRSNRIETLAGHFHADFHGVMVTGRPVNSFADVQQFWRDLRGLIGEGGTYTTTINPERSVILGDIALARGTTDDVVKTGAGKEYRVTTFWTATLQREGAAWKVRSLQGTMDPIGNPFVGEVASRAVMQYASGAGVIGLVLGLLLGRVWGRRRPAR